jgi:hypothetical protein
MRQILSMVAAFTALSLASAAIAQSPAPDKKPEFPKSIANTKPTHFRNGPLFMRAKSAFSAAQEDAAFSAFLAENAKVQLSSYFSRPPVHQTLDGPLIRAIVASCDGPLSYDEGSDWVQLNWVCRVDTDSPLARYYTFRESPEIVMMIYFQGNLIKSIDAMEPLPVPGLNKLSMDAYAAAHSKK